jgi:hypothetical protein
MRNKIELTLNQQLVTCNNFFSEKNYKCRDHNHLDGQYRGAACRICNRNNRKPRVLPIFFHSLSSYDSHLIIMKLNAVPGGVELIPNTEELYKICFKYKM